MALTNQQRLDRLKVRLEELAYWRAREGVPVTGWTIDGQPLAIGLSLLRSPIYPDPLADEGMQSPTYALLPHAGDWHEGGVREEAEDLNQPLLTREVMGLALGTTTPLRLSGIPAALSGLKPAEDGKGLVFRIYEPAGRRGEFAIDASGWSAAPVTLMEEPQSRNVTAELMPFEVRSWKLTRE